MAGIELRADQIVTDDGDHNGCEVCGADRGYYQTHTVEDCLKHLRAMLAKLTSVIRIEDAK